MGIFHDRLLPVTPETFRAEVLEAKAPVLLLFCTSWHKPSQMAITELEYVQDRHPGVKLCKVDGGDYPELMAQCRVLMMPTTLCFYKGRPVCRATGLRTSFVLEKMLPADFQEDRLHTLLEVTEDTFGTEVLEAEGPVLVLFYAGGDRISKMQMPELQSLFDKHEGLKICKVDCEEHPALMGEYSILLPPTTVAFRNGKAVRRSTGLRTREDLERLVSLACAAETGSVL